MRATVIIPTYNRPGRLARLVACLAEQEGDALAEVLVCDDGSSTDTTGAIAQYRERVPGLRVLWQPDLGFRAGQARNMGIREARGQVLVFLDDDLLLPRDFVATHVAAHVGRVNGSPDRRVVCGFRHRTEGAVEGSPSLETIRAGFPDDRVVHLGPEGAGIAAHPHPWFFVYSCNLSVPNDPETVWFNDSFVGWGMEDIELGYRLVRAGYQVVVEPRARVLHSESRDPRDPFRCEERGIEPCYDSYVSNTVQLIDTYPGDPALMRLLGSELRWYVRDAEDLHWVKNGFENDAEAVVAYERVLRAKRAGAVAAGLAAAPAEARAPGRELASR